MKSIKNLIDIAKKNPNLITLAIFFNCALLIHFHNTFLQNLYVFIFLFISVLLNFISIKFWFSAFFSLLVTFIYFLIYFPRVANHANLEFFFELVVLIYMIHFVWNKKNSFQLDKYQFTIKIALICIYFYAGFHKLNFDFFNTDTSCSGTIFQKAYQPILKHTANFSESLTRLSQIVTIIMEMVVPFGLIIKKIEKITLFILVIFHSFLNLAGFTDFSSFAGFFMLLATINVNMISTKMAYYIKFYVGLVLVIVCSKVIIQNFKLDCSDYVFKNGFLFSMGWLSFFFYYLRKEYQINFTPNPSKNAILFCVLFFSFWSLKGYFGFGNLANLTMFSNLTTEASRSNHLFINTKFTKITNLEEDNVMILELSDELKYEKLEGYLLPTVEFKYKIHEWTNYFEGAKLHAKIVYKKDTLEIKNLKYSEFNNAKWYYKYFYFRKIQPDGPTECYW